MSKDCSDVQQVSQKLETVTLKGDKDAKTAVIRLYLCTWNVGGGGPPKDLMELLDLKANPLPDIYGIGFQEMDPKDSDSVSNMWTSRLTDELAELDYVRIKVVRMQAISLQVFVKRTMLLSITSLESEYSKAGMGGWWGNKGGVSVRFDVGGVNLIIVNCHLAAHLEMMAERIEDVNTILNTQKFRDPDVDNILDHDYIFWMGDLNCRLDDTSRESVLHAIEKNDMQKLLKLDQLRRAQEEGLIFPGFKEGPITFKPTYKFDPGTDTYDTSEKKRIPAWCDRVLYKVQTDLEGLQAKKKKYDSPPYNVGDHKPVAASFEINLLHYKSHPNYKESDHKPMTALFDVKLFGLSRSGLKGGGILGVENTGKDNLDLSRPVLGKGLQYSKANKQTFTKVVSLVKYHKICQIFDDQINPWVTFSPIKNWKYGQTQEFHYTVRCGIQPDTSPWDWIGLYKATFKHFDDYVTYVRGVNNAEKLGDKGVSLTIKGGYLETPPGKYVLLYISKYKGWLRGMSNVFEIVP